MSRRRKDGRWGAVLGSAMILSAGLFVGCGSEQLPMQPQEDPSSSIAALHGSAWIDAGGGVLEIGPYTLVFPTDALSQNTLIEIQQLNVGEWPVELSPHGIEFSRPVTLRMDAQEERDPESLQIHWWNSSTKEWEAIASKISGGVVATRLSHFSRYTLD